MKTRLLIIAFFAICVAKPAFSQTLEKPKLKSDFAESGGTFLIVNTWDEIKKSTLKFDDISKLQQQVSTLTKDLAEAKSQITDQQRTISSLKSALNSLDRELSDLRRKIEELQRKVK
jgi:peptidoglycan hydrolase CwlO-like protein